MTQNYAPNAFADYRFQTVLYGILGIDLKSDELGFLMPDMLSEGKPTHAQALLFGKPYSSVPVRGELLLEDELGQPNSQKDAIDKTVASLVRLANSDSPVWEEKPLAALQLIRLAPYIQNNKFIDALYVAFNQGKMDAIELKDYAGLFINGTLTNLFLQGELKRLENNITNYTNMGQPSEIASFAKRDFERFARTLANVQFEKLGSEGEKWKNDYMTRMVEMVNHSGINALKSVMSELFQPGQPYERFNVRKS